MATVIKIVWRFDFPVNYSFLDKYGTVARLILETVPNFFPQIAEGAPRTALIGSYAGSDEIRNITVETTSISGTLEWIGGIDIARLPSDDQFRNINRVADEILKALAIKNVIRGGFRVYCLGKRAPKVLSKNMFMSSIDPRIAHGIESVLGTASDIGFIIEGSNKEALKYRLNFGPFEEKNIAIAFEREVEISPRIREDLPQLFYDLDISESAFMLSQPSLYKWSRTKLEKAVEIVTFFDQLDEGV